MSENTGFWARGKSDHRIAIASAEEREVAELEERILAASPEGREALMLELKEVRAKYKAQRRSSDHALYLKDD